MAMHYPSLAEMADVELVGIAELNEQRLKAAADKYGVAARYGDYRKMLEETAPDAVYCIMPPMQLFDVVVDCLERRRHVFIDKPPGMTKFQTATWARMAERNHCITMCGFNRRHIPCLKQAKERVEERGPITQCAATFTKCSLGQEGYYRGAIDTLTCDAIHAVDSLRWLGGDVDRVASDIGSFESAVPNMFNALIKFKSGAAGFLITNWASGGRVHTWEIFGRGITAYVNPDTTGAHIHKDDKLEAERIDPVESAGSPDRHRTYGFFGENRHFIDCVKAGRLPTSHFADAIKTMELVETLYHSQI
jgi:predicted dehydrogenase